MASRTRRLLFGCVLHDGGVPRGRDHGPPGAGASPVDLVPLTPVRAIREVAAAAYAPPSPAPFPPQLTVADSLSTPCAGRPWSRTRARSVRTRIARRFRDDRDLAGVKIMLLATLLILTAMLERVM